MAEARPQTSPGSIEDAMMDFEMSVNVGLETPSGNSGALDTAVALKPVRIMLLDIGQGNATLVMGPKDESILIDCGSVTSGDIMGELVASATEVINRYLPVKNKLDYLVISHPDKDHVNKVAQVLKGFAIGEVICGGQPSAYDQQGKQEFDVFLKSIGKSVRTSIIEGWDYCERPDHPRDERKVKNLSQGFDVFVVSANAKKRSGSQISELLGLTAAKGGTEANCSSIVLCIRATDQKTQATAQALICADATFSTEYFIMTSAWKDALRSYLLCGGHHGSADSFSPTFLKAVDPSLVHFSANMHGRFRHPTWEAVSRLRTNCPRMSSNTECGPHDVVIGCTVADRPKDIQSGLLEPGKCVTHILNVMQQEKRLCGWQALALFVGKIPNGNLPDYPLWVQEAHADAATRIKLNTLSKEHLSEKGASRVSPLTYYGLALDDILKERTSRAALTFDEKEPYWDSNTIEFGLISSLEGANTGVNWEVTLFGGERFKDALHGVTRF